jgi:hypothetical protein
MDTKPSIAFLIFRMNCYRVMASAIDAALSRGWYVECWHDVRPAPNAQRQKDVPDQEGMPTFLYGHVQVRYYHGWPEAIQLVAQKHVDVVVSIVTLIGLQPGDLPDLPDRSYYVLLEPSPADWTHSIKQPEQLRQVDLFAITTAHWIEQDLRVLKDVAPFTLSPTEEQQLRQKMVAVGWPQADQFLQMDSAKIRRKWGIPESQPVVVYLNLPFVRNMESIVFRNQHMLHKARALWDYRCPLRDIWTHMRAPDIHHVMQALHTFARRNGAHLIGKYRHRDVTLPSEQQAVDTVVYDEIYYPHTIVEVMHIADISFSYYSWGVREAVAGGSPHVMLHIPGMISEWHLKTFASPGGFFNMPDVVRVLDINTTIQQLPHMKLGDFQMSRSVYDDYYRTYIGIPGIKNGDVFLDAMDRLITQ